MNQESGFSSNRLKASMLPLTSTSPEPRFGCRRRLLSVRFLKTAGISLVVCFALFVLAFPAQLQRGRLFVKQWLEVPRYDQVYSYEAALPQHNPSLPYPEGKNGRYLKFAVPYHSIGFNNQLQDIIMASQTAYLSGRAYVFQPFLYAERPSKFTVFKEGKWRSASIPLNTLLAGPIAGGPMSHPNSGLSEKHLQVVGKAPRSVSYDHYEQVCPRHKRVYVNVYEGRKEMHVEEGNNPKGIETLELWSQKLLAMNETCVELVGDHLWQFWHFGRADIVTAWKTLSASPMMAEFEWSPYVHDIVRRNWRLVAGKRLQPSQQLPSTVPGLMALHIRRGDFIQHCDNLEGWGASFGGWSQFPEFTDRFDLNAPEKDANYKKHCLPNIAQIIEKVQTVRKEWQAQTSRKLSRVFIMTNAEPEFLAALRGALSGDDWEVADTTQMALAFSEKEIDMVADMMIGQIAEVFVGNGFSTLTSDINLVRLAKGSPWSSIRFW